MPGGFNEDVIAALDKRAEVIKQQVLLEIITIANNCDDFGQFKKVLWARALGFLKQFEDEGLVKPGTTAKAARGEKF